MKSRVNRLVLLFFLQTSYVLSAELQGTDTVSFCNGEGKKVILNSKRCSSNIIFPKGESRCVCYDGFHGVTKGNSCASLLLTGTKCIKISEEEDMHWKILKSVPKGPFVYVQTRNPNSGNHIQWTRLKIDTSMQTYGPTTTYFSGVNVFRQNDRNYFCAQPRAETTAGAIVQISTDERFGQINFAGSCDGRSDFSLMGENDFSKSAQNPSDDDCKLDCSEEVVESTEKVSFPGMPLTDAEEKQHHHLDILLRKDSVDSTFDDYKLNGEIFKPIRSFEILSTIFRVAKDLCTGTVFPRFLDKGMELFKSLHEGQNYVYQEIFQEEEIQSVLSLLNECRIAEDPAHVLIDPCSGQAIMLEAFHQNGTYISKPVEGSDKANIVQHHIPEIAWKVVNLVNVACLKSFKRSYLLYHKMEMAMEKLFTEEIKRLWHYPSTDADTYKQLLGADELTNLVNLQSCVDAFYLKNFLVHPLQRPREAGYWQLLKEFETKEEGGPKCVADTVCKSLYDYRGINMSVLKDGVLVDIVKDRS